MQSLSDGRMDMGWCRARVEEALGAARQGASTWWWQCSECVPNAMACVLLAWLSVITHHDSFPLHCAAICPVVWISLATLSRVLVVQQLISQSVMCGQRADVSGVSIPKMLCLWPPLLEDFPCLCTETHSLEQVHQGMAVSWHKIYLAALQVLSEWMRWSGW